MRARLLLALLALAALFAASTAEARCVHGLPLSRTVPPRIELPPGHRVRLDPDCVFAIGPSRANAVSLRATPSLTIAELFDTIAARRNATIAATDFIQSWDSRNVRHEALTLRRHLEACTPANLIVVRWDTLSATGLPTPTVALRSGVPGCSAVRLRNTTLPPAITELGTTAAPLPSHVAAASSPHERVEVAVQLGAHPIWVDVGPLELHAPAPPAQHFFAAHADVVTLVTDWSTGSLRLAPVGAWADYPRLFDELLVAASAGELWLSRDHEIVADLTGYLDANPRRMRLPDTTVDAWMTRRYGAPGAALTPTMQDWHGILGGLSLCHIREYLPSRPAIGRAVPDDARCVPLRSLIELPLEFIGRGDRRYRVTHEHRARIISRDNEVRAPEAERRSETFSLPSDTETWPLLAVRGDRFRIGASGARPWSYCVAGRCTALSAVEGYELVMPVTHAGVIEVRPGRHPGPPARQGLVLLRVIAIDPDRDVLPVGLTRGAAGDRPWDAVSRDSDDTFGFARRSQRIALALAMDGAAVAAWNRRTPVGNLITTPSVLSSDLPLVTARTHPPGDTAPPAMALLVSRDAACPTASVNALRASVPPDATAVPVDGVFYVHLVQPLDDRAPPRCLARVRFRARPERLIASQWPVQLGVLGDLRTTVTLTGPYAVGAVLPLLYSRMHIPGGFVVEVGTALSAFAGFSDGALHRAGLTSTFELAWGPPFLPRVLAAGGLCDLWTHDAGTTRPPRCAAQVSLNLVTLYEVLGGR